MPFLGIEEGETLVNPLLSVRGIGVSFGVVVEAELEAAARADHVSGAAVSSRGGSGKRSYPQTGQINSFLLMTMV